MKKIYALLISCLFYVIVFGQISITSTSTAFTQDFNTLTNTGTSTTIPAGWAFLETGTNANLTYTAGTGSANGGDTYSFGAAASTDRAFGGLQSGSLIPSVGASFTNNTGTVINTLNIAYTGEQWRLGALGRADRLEFFYSTNATSLGTGTYIAEPTLNFTAPTTTGAAGALDGNLAANRTNITSSITGLNIPNGATFWIKWTDFNATGADDGLSIDDFSITVPGGADVTPPLASTFTPADNAVNVSTSTNLSILFNEPIQKGTGNIIIKKLSDNSVVQTIDVTTAAVIAAGNTVTVTINPLQIGTAYYVEIDATAIKDIANNNYAGIVGNTSWDFTTSAALLDANFNTCTATLTDGFTQFSVTGTQVWACTTFGHSNTNPSPTASAPSGVQINGFASGSNVINEDWLISPSLNLVATNFPLLSFWSRTAFNGAPLKLRVSTNYSGTGNPSAATWIDINGSFPLQTSDAWKLSQNINLSAYKTANTYIAFVYNSTDDDGARWTLDDVKIDNSLTPPPATLTPNTSEVNFGFVASGSTSVKTMNFTGNDITGGVTLTATGNFLISKTNGSFTPSISYTQAEANNINKIVFIQFAPTAPTVSYTGNLTISTPLVTDTIITLKGNSIDAATTLDVVNWNIEWFGSTTLGPTNDNLQEQNIKTVLQNINADVYALVEVVSEPRLANIVSQMPGYSYVLSNYGSYTNPNQPGTGPLSEAQKLGLVYKTALFPGGLTSQALLSAGINSAADITNPAYNWYASGRFPFMVTGTTTLNGVTKQIRFVITHAKANTSPTLTSYARRKAGNDSLLIHLNNFYPNDNIIFLGDFNDDLDSTITAGINPKLSSYKQFTDDVTHFYSPTLPLSLAGKKSTVSYNDVIDHVMLSNEMQCSYLAGSAAILTDVAGLIPNYGNTTTDHYPVFSRYLFVQPQAATLSYAGSPYCSSAGTANATFTGTTGGVYSSTTGLSINATTGAINLAASTAGTYVVTYTLAANGICNPLFTTTANVTITAAPAATISYAGSPYCSNVATATVTRTGTTGGVYSSTTGLSINATTGDVNIATSTLGTYTVTYTVAAAGGCALFATTTSITITAAPAATITYGAAPYCSNAGTANVTRTGTTSGVYSSTTGLSINASSGAVTLATSIAGTYTVTYTIAAAGGCAIFTTTAPITITAAASATINYTGSPYCQAATTATITRTGNAGGVYSSTSGLVINATTGDIDVAASAAGTYVVTYTIAANGGCAIFTTTTNIIINSISVAPTSAVTSSTLICGNSGTVSLTANGETLGTGASYKWYSGTCGGTLVGTGISISNIFLNTTTTFFVRAEGTCNTTSCQSITVVVAPQPVVEISISPNTGVTPAAPVTIMATVSPAATYSYLWTKNNTTNLSTNVDRIIVSADEAGNYKVKVTAPSGCTTTSTNAFLASAASKTLFISANPNRGIFNVSYNNAAANLIARTLNVYDSKGAKVFTQSYNNNVPYSYMKVDISNEGKGIYFVELRDAAGKKLADGKVQVL
jgi:Bacterial Ig-like domain/Ig-like domain CHU_C associated/Secretion system C-terminal sorting domain